jgi:hypothetical protein
MPIITCPFPAIVIVIDSAICNKPSALNCQHRLLSQLNGPSTADMSDAIQLRTFLLDQMSISADRMARICTAISDMFMCFGSIQLDACLNADALIGDRILNVTQAYAWSSTIAQIRFSCGAGFDGAQLLIVFDNHDYFFLAAIQSQYECFARVMRLQNATLARCWTDFEANIAHSDPSALCRL